MRCFVQIMDAKKKDLLTKYDIMNFQIHKLLQIQRKNPIK